MIFSMRLRISGSAILLFLSVTGVTGAQTSRTVHEPAWERGWMRGAPPDDTLFADPFSLTGTPEIVAVLDPRQDRVVALRSSDGTVAWVYAGNRARRRTFAGATAPAVGYNGDVIIGTQGPSSLVIIDSAGRLKRTVPISIAGGHLDAVCESRPGEYLISMPDPLSPAFYVIDSLGTVRQRIASPFDPGKSVPGMAKMMMSQVALVSAVGSGTCVAAQRIGNTFAIFKDGRFGGSIRYVVPSAGADVDPAQLVPAALPPTAYAVFAEDSVLYVVSTVGAGRRYDTIDRYRLPTGEYLGSWRAPHGVTAMAIAGDNLALLHGHEKRFVISQYRKRQ